MSLSPSPHTQEMTEDERQAIEEWGRCDFTQIHEYYKERAELRKQMSKDEKKELKAENEKILEEYGWAIIDGHRYNKVCCCGWELPVLVLFCVSLRERIGNFKTEPPGLFRGRGDHPKQGRIKVCPLFVLL